MINLSGFAEPVDSPAPCGPDCEYEGDFLALALAAQGKPEQQFGDAIIPAVDPDWRAVDQMARDLLGRTKDLRVATLLTTAVTVLQGIAGFAAGVQLVHLLCTRYWGDVHPRMDADGEHDPFMRASALAELGNADLLKALRGAELLSRPLPITLRDLEQLSSRDGAARYTEPQVLSALADGFADSAGAEAFQSAHAGLTALEQYLGEQLGADRPDWSALQALLHSAHAVVQRVHPGAAAATLDGEAPTENALDGGAAALVAASPAPGEIRSREDVRRALRRIDDYLQRNEPSNPAALFVRRAESMLDKSFMDIIRDLAPDAISHLEMIAGSASASDPSS